MKKWKEIEWQEGRWREKDLGFILYRLVINWKILKMLLNFIWKILLVTIKNCLSLNLLAYLT